MNIDLDNLGMKKAPVKQSIPMSQMAKMSASSTPNIGQHTKCWLMFFTVDTEHSSKDGLLLLVDPIFFEECRTFSSNDSISLLK